MSETPISRQRSRMIEDTSLRKFGENDCIRHVKTFSTFLGRSHYASPLDLLTPPNFRTPARRPWCTLQAQRWGAE